MGLSEVVPFLLASTLQQRGALYHGRLVIGQNPQPAHGVGVALRSLFIS